MEVRLTLELENELAGIAARSNRTPQQVAAEVLTRGLQRERWFINSVEQGIASANPGRLIRNMDRTGLAASSRGARIVLMRAEWTADALADLRHIPTFDGERTHPRTRRPHVSQNLGRGAGAASAALGLRIGRAAGSRELVVTDIPWITVHRINSDAIQLLRILHGAEACPASA